MDRIDPRTPVLVGIGVVQQKEQDPAIAREAVELMIDAAQAAGTDSGVPALLGRIERVGVPRGLWSYVDPARTIATAVGSPAARSVIAEIGILQQTLFGDACRRIAAGEIQVALVAGGEARFRQLQAQIRGVEASETPGAVAPDEVLAPEAELVLEVEAHSGLGYMPVGYYALLESAFRHAQGLGVEEHRDRIATLYSRFSEIAAGNPHAWKREVVPAATIRDPSPKNRMLAFPYTKLHNTSWNVDQAAALLFCSAGLAAELGIAREKWIFPLASTESNHMLPVSQRPELQHCPGARIAGERALGIAGLGVADIDLLDLYSCFPIAVESYAAELGVPEGRDLTVTGGMPFAGGPLNNYVLQATARMGELLRERGRGTGLVSSVSGYLTKQGFGIWSADAPRRPFGFADVGAEVAALSPARTVLQPADGQGRILACTVIYHDDRALCAVAIVEYADGSRTLASNPEPAVIQRIESEECCGVDVQIVGRQFTLA
jgi:acetyl-CoA C-acetyltransferase